MGTLYKNKFKPSAKMGLLDDHESDMLNHATSKSESNTALHIQRQYIQAFQAAQSQQYAQICSAVQLNEYQQLQKFAERQRHLELEQIKAKEKTQVTLELNKCDKGSMDHLAGP